MKYFEFVIALFCWLLAFFWVKNSVQGEFPYEPLLAFFAGISLLVDSLRRFETFSSVSIIYRSPNITPWAFTGAKIEKTNISTEIIFKNDKNIDSLIRAIDITAPASVIDSIGGKVGNIRLVDIGNGNADTHLPINIHAKSSKTILIEITHNASNIEKNKQALSIGKLKNSELFILDIQYAQGTKEKTAHSNFNINTSTFLSTTQKRYLEHGDKECTSKITNETKTPAPNNKKELNISIGTINKIISKIWHDPVWSKIISAIIITIFGILATTTKSCTPFFTKKTQQTEIKNQPSSYQDIDERNRIILGFTSCADNKEKYSIRDKLVLSLEINSTERRESAISSIVHEAICAGDYSLAREAFYKIKSSEEKSNTAQRAIAVLITNKKIDEAKSWLPEIINPEEKDWWIQKISAQ